MSVSHPVSTSRCVTASTWRTSRPPWAMTSMWPAQPGSPIAGALTSAIRYHAIGLAGDAGHPAGPADRQAEHRHCPRPPQLGLQGSWPRCARPVRKVATLARRLQAPPGTPGYGRRDLPQQPPSPSGSAAMRARRSVIGEWLPPPTVQSARHRPACATRAGSARPRTLIIGKPFRLASPQQGRRPADQGLPRGRPRQRRPESSRARAEATQGPGNAAAATTGAFMLPRLPQRRSAAFLE